MVIQQLENLPAITTVILSVIGIVIGVVAIVYAAATQIYAVKIKKRYLSLVRGESGADFEALFNNNHSDIAELRNEINNINTQISDHERRIKQKTAQVKIKRYNAFGETGNDLSFSIALLNEEGNGIVLSSIYGRDESRVFAKPILKNDAPYKLTAEEQEVIRDSSVSRQ